MRLDWIAFSCGLPSLPLFFIFIEIASVAPESEATRIIVLITGLIAMLSLAFVAKRRGLSYFWGFSAYVLLIPLLRSGFRSDLNRARLSEIDEQCKGNRKLLVEERNRLQQVRAMWQRKSLMFGGSGLILSIAVGVLMFTQADAPSQVSPIIGLLGLIAGILISMGIAFAMRHRGGSVLWGLFGIIGFIGVLILVFRPDLNRRRLQEISDLIEATSSA